MDQRSDEWFQARLGIPTASRYGDIMAGSHLAGWRNYKAELVIERITGVPTESYTSGAMQWGTDFESVAALAYELETGNELRDAFFIKHPSIDTGASPDKFVNKDGLLETKCPNSATHIDTLITEQIPKKYYAQMQGQMMCTGRAWVDYVSYDPRMPEGLKLFIKRVFRDDEYIKRLEEQLIKFLSEVEEEVKQLKTIMEGKHGAGSKATVEKHSPKTRASL